MSTTVKPQDDAALLAEYARARTPAAFEAFARRHADWIYSAALRITREPAMAEDVMQGVMLAASRKAPQLSRHPAVVSWLFRATRFGAGAVLRAERRRRRHESEAARISAKAGQGPEWTEVREALDATVAALPSHEREAILLRFYRQLSYAEISAELRIAEEAARKRVSRAVTRLRGKLGIQDSDASLATMLETSAVTRAPKPLSFSSSAGPGARLAADAVQAASTLMRLKLPAALLAILAMVGLTLATWGTGHPAASGAAPAVSASMPATRTAGRDIVVRVVDGEERSVAGASVGAQVWALGTGKTLDNVVATTDASGNGTLRLPQDGIVKFIFASKGDVGLDYFAVWPAEHIKQDPFHLEQNFAGPLKFTLNGAKRIRVHAQDEAGKPLAGVEVYPWVIGKPGKGEDLNVFQFRQRTNAEGNASIAEIPADTTTPRITVWAKLDGYTSPARWVWDASRPDEVLNVTLVRQVHVKGKVSDGAAEPIGNGTVTIAGAGRDSMTNFVQTSVPVAADGTFEADLDPDMAYVFVAFKGHYVSRQVSRVILREPPKEPLVLELAEGIHVVGQVTEGEQGRPVSDLRLSLMLRGETPKDGSLDTLPNPANNRHAITPFIWQAVRTDAEGGFEFFACPGDYYTDTSVPGERNMQQLKLTGAERERRVDIRLRRIAPIPASFRGRVVRTVDGADVPVPEAKLSGQPEETLTGLGSPSAVADGEGRFQMEHPAGDLFVYAESPDGSLRSLTKVDAAAKEVTIRVGPAATVHGRVVDGEGRSVAGLPLDYGIRFTTGKSLSGPMWTMRFGGKVSTGADGTFDLPNLVPGQAYELRVVIGAGADMSWQTLKKELVADKPGRTDIGDMTFKPPERPTTRRR